MAASDFAPYEPGWSHATAKDFPTRFLIGEIEGVVGSISDPELQVADTLTIVVHLHVDVPNAGKVAIQFRTRREAEETVATIQKAISRIWPKGKS